MSNAVRTLRFQDGSESRAFYRTFTGTSQLFYAAAMRPWTTGDSTYLAMAFPFGRVQVMVLLGFTNEGTGTRLSTRTDDLAGAYTIIPGRERFVALPGPPTEEELTTQPELAGLTVLHEDFLGSRRTFAVRYRIELSRRAATAGRARFDAVWEITR